MSINNSMEIHKKLKEVSQSLWLDSISRDMILNNTLSSFIEKYQITGLTSNPTIFENAILNSSSYDNSIKMASKKFKTEDDIAYSIMIEDIQRACDLLKKTYETTNGDDGYVSIEIPPTINEKSKMVECAEKIYEMVSRPNLMIKIPATQQGIEAEEELIKKGINVNMTLIFSPHIYTKVADAYISAMKWRVENKVEGNVFSVASFFVSRIDSEVSKELDKIISNTDDIDRKNEILMFKGKAAVALSLITYEIYRNKFYTQSFEELRKAGIKPQKLLWASTSTKDPSMRDTLYVDELFLPNTINTIPTNTLFAFFDHGRINLEDIETRINQAKEIYQKIEKNGIIWQAIFENLLYDGMDRFVKSYNKILDAIRKKIKKTDSLLPSLQLYNLEIEQTINQIKNKQFIKRLFLKDPTLWKKDSKSAQQIKKSLGWLDIASVMKKNINNITTLRDEVIKEGFRYAVLLGMGGSSLGSEVISSIFGEHKKIKLYILDSTNPQWIARISSKIKIEKTLFIVSSKSGTTLETLTQFKYFYSLLKKRLKKPGRNFIAITDSSTPLQEIAKKYSFRKIFINPSDIGGRFSVFSYFGLLPASFTACNIERLIEKAEEAQNELTNNETPPAIVLGCFMGKAFLSGRDKLTLIVPKKFERFGLWVEQLIAESTGKEGKGIVPIVDTELLNPQSYSNDRFFVIISCRNFYEYENEEKINNIIKNGHPVLRVYLNDRYDVATEFYRWEVATAVAGHIMEINPFDQPDVQFTKDFTKKVLQTKTIKLKPSLKTKDIEIYTANITINEEKDLLWQILKNISENGYFSLCAYIDENNKNDTMMKRIKKLLTENIGITSLCVYGPRYLHSIGQLFKGGKNNGIFLILTHKSKKDIKILGEDSSFDKICTAQAIGDFLAMKEKGRMCVMVHTRKEPAHILKKIISELESYASKNIETEGKTMPKTTTKNLKTKQSETKVKNEAYVVIDYPKHQEVITSPYYTIRIGTSPTSSVEVSIDGGPWMNARESVGYWWYDWHNITPGNHEIIARIKTSDGTYITSKRRRCKVVL